VLTSFVYVLSELVFVEKINSPYGKGFSEAKMAVSFENFFSIFPKCASFPDCVATSSYCPRADSARCPCKSSFRNGVTLHCFLGLTT
jgi:hypothetical protein